MGPSLRDRPIPASDLFGRDSPLDAGAAERASKHPFSLVAAELAQDMTPILQVKGLTKQFGGLVAVNDVSFEIQPNAILSVIGPNGAGKSTIFKLISSFLKPTRGEVLFKGERISGLAPHIVARKGVVRTFQGGALTRLAPAMVGRKGVVPPFQEDDVLKGVAARDSVIVAHHLRSRA